MLAPLPSGYAAAAGASSESKAVSSDEVPGSLLAISPVELVKEW